MIRSHQSRLSVLTAFCSVTMMVLPQAVASPPDPDATKGPTVLRRAPLPTTHLATQTPVKVDDPKETPEKGSEVVEDPTGKDPTTPEGGSTGVVDVALPTGPERPWVYPKFSTAEWLILGAGAALALSSRIAGTTADPVINRIGFDESVREAVVAGPLSSERVAQEISDILLTATVSYAVVVDALILTGWYRSSPESAIQMGLIDLEAFAITAGINGLVTVLVGRPRPYDRRCGGELAEDVIDCEDDDRFRSFFSGHTSIAFTAAALSCSHHMELELFNDPTADTLSCVTGFLFAGATGFMRMVGDKHYLTDVLTGAAFGTLVGFAVPYLFHYNHGPDDDDKAPSDGATFNIVPMGLGAQATGTF